MNERDKAVVQQALEFLEIISPQFPPLVYTETDRKRDEAITALRQLLEQPAPVQEEKQSEIFCGVDFEDGVLSVSVLRRRPNDVAELLHSEQIDLPLPAQPDDHGDILTIAYLDGVHTGKQIAKREWVDLTDEEIMDRWPIETRIEFARAIEAKLREKNGGNHG
jgi:hypothetical protein